MLIQPDIAIQESTQKQDLRNRNIFFQKFHVVAGQDLAEMISNQNSCDQMISQAGNIALALANTSILQSTLPFCSLIG